MLLDQRASAGIGNIYADEALFAAKVRPDRPARSLSPEEDERLYDAIRQVLLDALGNRGSSFRDCLDAEMERRKMRNPMTLQVHDELIFECPGDELEEMRRLVLDIMPNSMEMNVPLKVDTKVGRNWGEMEYGEPSGVEEMG